MNATHVMYEVVSAAAQQGYALFCTFQEALDFANDTKQSRWDIREVLFERLPTAEYKHLRTVATVRLDRGGIEVRKMDFPENSLTVST